MQPYKRIFPNDKEGNGEQIFTIGACVADPPPPLIILNFSKTHSSATGSSLSQVDFSAVVQYPCMQFPVRPSHGCCCSFGGSEGIPQVSVECCT